MMATDISDVRRTVLSDMGIATTSSNLDVAKACDVLFIAVKPNVVRAVLQEVKASLTADTLIVSIAAGVTLSVLQVPHTPPGSKPASERPVDPTVGSSEPWCCGYPPCGSNAPIQNAGAVVGERCGALVWIDLHLDSRHSLGSAACALPVEVRRVS
jgi:hypothetical protein